MYIYMNWNEFQKGIKLLNINEGELRQKWDDKQGERRNLIEKQFNNSKKLFNQHGHKTKSRNNFKKSKFYKKS